MHIARTVQLLMFCLLAINLIAAPVRANDLPDLGDSSATLISAEEDKRLGDAFMRSMRQYANIIEDPELNTYINSVGYRLLAAADSSQPFHFFIVDDPAINAFAGPGGHIGIHSGLILAAENEGELAAVMAHEIAHVTQHHLARAVQKASNAQIQTIAAIMAALLLGAPPDVTLATMATATAGNLQQQLNFTRAHEKEADRVGVDTMARAGYDPHYMPEFFGRLQEAYRYMDNSLPELLRTHPVTPNRIADSQNRADQYSKIQDKASGNFALIKAKLYSLSSDDQSYRRQTLAKRYESKQGLTEAEQYEYARFQLQRHQLAMAATLSKMLIDAAPENIHYIALRAEVLQQQGQTPQAQQLLTRALTLFPNDAELTLLYADTLIELGQPEQASDLLGELIRQSETFLQPMYYRALAKAEFAADDSSHAYQALAEYYFITGNTRTAIEQLRSAIDATADDNHYQQAKLAARLAELEEQALIEQQMQRDKNHLLPN